MIKSCKHQAVRPIYRPRAERAMNVVAFGSGSGSNIEAIISYQKQHPSLFLVKAIFTDRKCRCQEIALREDIPLLYLSFVNFFRSRGEEDFSSFALREEYDREVGDQLDEASERYGFTVDLIILAGYMRIVTRPLLHRFSDKIINVHPADLSVKGGSGKRKYVGGNAVEEALSCGESMTRSCVIMVDEGMDEGPVLVSGPWVKYSGGVPPCDEDVRAHQDEQKATSDWPALTKAVELIASGNAAIDQSGTVFIEGIPQGSCGYDMSKQSITI